MKLPPEIENMATQKLKEQLKHSISHCALDGPRLWQNPFQSENLFEVVVRMERYVVDSNSNWKAESKISKNRNVAFILGQTVTTEEDNLKSLYFSRKVNMSNNNLFYFGLDDITGELLVALERLDTAFSLTFDRAKLNEESRLRSKRTDHEFQLRQSEESA